MLKLHKCKQTIILKATCFCILLFFVFFRTIAMVVSKKCKVCTALDADNIAISGVYCDKSLPNLIEKISGIKLDPRKANGGLICKLCATQLVHIDVFVDKLRSRLQRLTKLVKEKPKYPSKDTTEGNSLIKIEQELKQNIKLSKTLTTLTKIQDKTQNTPKGMIRLKSVCQNNNEETNIQNSGAESNVSKTEFKKILDNEVISKNVHFNSNERNKEIEQEAKVTKKVVRRESEIPKDNLPPYNDDLQQNGDQSCNISAIKFKKIADDKVTPVKSTQAKAGKRKEMSKENGVECESKYLKQSNICEPAPVKRNKTVSISGFEDNSIDLTTDEHDITESCNEKSLAEVKIKILNCVICGKGYNQKASLREHIESSHMGEKLKQCPNCLTEFRSQQKYESHVFSEKCKNSKHTCQYPKCNRRFKTVLKMELHMQEKHFSPQQESE